MATDYNDGRWHGWNGDPCPINLRSEVELIWADDKGGVSKRDGLAGNMAFEGNDFGRCIAFRVVRVAPVECWISRSDPSTVIYHPPVYDPSNWRVFREVTDAPRPLPNLEDA